MKEKITKKKTTLDDLALMVGRGFNAVDKRFDDVNKRFEQVDKKFEQVDRHFDEINKRLDNIESRIFINHENRFDRIEDKIRILETTQGR